MSLSIRWQSSRGRVAVSPRHRAPAGSGIATVVCVDIDAAAAQETAGTASTSSTSARVDVSSAAACDELVAQSFAELGRLDILVNNAGINRDAIASAR